MSEAYSNPNLKEAIPVTPSLSEKAWFCKTYQLELGTLGKVESRLSREPKENKQHSINRAILKMFARSYVNSTLNVF